MNAVIEDKITVIAAKSPRSLRLQNVQKQDTEKKRQL
jgi:hypothetical protein